ncbi:pre-mRNA-splicing factor CWC25 homolog [Cynara cardunculus var. scolymus]|uniref:CBF1-interacting co-repressor CIR, N-terminal domain-containing protein n=1 Tax=Cynara cardunculus var. scolymus TaxID=59895 RepID=A0A103XTQ7_CYNCS|nr:pre-mRNA-splicing factor CWC25 homolog [Cynara cardunculus var. scolymus]KVH96690.1 CBF1-interacting co-repressor CIR, N-terminal domain-containing protein [Cynara cardunculus var. scolymus]
MALKFLNKKGWHTGSLRNIENVWKAEQKHDAEQKKLEELRKQIHEERERSEFRLLQEQAGLVPKQERLDFLYDSGLAVGKGNSDGFKALESFPAKAEPEQPSSANKASTPGALFEDKPQSANDAWRKLHSDPLLLIKQREQEALARVKNNPVQMAMIHKSVEAKKHKEKTSDGEKHKEKHHRKKLKHEKHTSSKHHINSDDDVGQGEGQRSTSSSHYSKHKRNIQTERVRDGDRYQHERYHGKDHFGPQSTKRDREDHFSSQSAKREKEDHFGSQSTKRDREDHSGSQSTKRDREGHYSSQSAKRDKEDHFGSQSAKRDEADHSGSQSAKRDREDHIGSQSGKRDGEDRKHLPPRHHKVGEHNRRNSSMKLSEEERAAKLKEMQMDAEVHEEQRWKRLKQAADDDAKEATRASSSGRNFLDAAHKSVFGAEKGGSSTIEESVRRRTHYSQRRSEENAFRR